MDSDFAQLLHACLLYQKNQKTSIQLKFIYSWKFNSIPLNYMLYKKQLIKFSIFTTKNGGAVNAKSSMNKR